METSGYAWKGLFLIPENWDGEGDRSFRPVGFTRSSDESKTMVDLSVNIGKLRLKNPVLTASGTFGYGEEFADFIDLDRLGGIVVKAVTGKNRDGNAYPRMAETPSGMLNSVGLQNKGVDHFIKEIYPGIRDFKTCLIVNVSGSTLEEYVEVAEKINELEKIPAIELNISCPNVKHGGMAFGTSVSGACEVTRAVRKVYRKDLIVKLSPNVTSITDIAKAVADGGADMLSLINTLLGMAIDVGSRRPVLSTFTGGLSGPAVKPVALRMVWQVHKAVKLPIIGLGGIMNATDAIEFLLAGASAIQVGTANFIDPAVTLKIIDGIEAYMRLHKTGTVTELVGGLKTD
jgi:dihydroorotate dehydrogenase (NAD+) catalytic subunit